MVKAHSYSFRKAANGNDVVRVRCNGLYRWFNTFIDAAAWVMSGAKYHIG